MGRHFKHWGQRSRGSRGSGGTRGSSHDKASATKSYHNGGVEGSPFASWYDKYLSKSFDDTDDNTNGSGSGGTKGSGSGGTKGSGSGGTKGSGSGGTKGSGSGGTKGSGSGGTKGSGNQGDNTTDAAKTSQAVSFGDPPQVNVTATATTEGQIFIDIQSVSFEGDVADVDGLAFNMASNDVLDGLNFFPDPLSIPVTGFSAAADAVNVLPNGTDVGGTYDAAVQFGQEEGSTNGVVNTVNFTLWSDNGPLTLEDIDLSQLSLVITDSDGQTQVLTGDVVEGEPGDESSGGTKGSGSGGTKGSGSGGTKGSGSGGTKGSGSGGTKGSGSGGTRGSGSGGTKGSGSGGTKGSGSGGTKGSGSGGTKGSGSGGTKGSGSGGTKGSGSGGTKGSGSGGTKGSGSGGTKGSGSGGTKGSGSGGTKGSGSGGTKGSGSGGTKGSGSGGTKGSGSGGTKGSGSGGTKGSGSGGTKGSGSGGTKGSGSGGTTGGHSQWSGHDASAAASTLPVFEPHPEDSEDVASVDELVSLMTNADEEGYQTTGSATAGDIDLDMF